MGKSSAKEWPKKAFVVAMATLSLCSCRQPDVGDVYITRRNLSVSSNEGECTIGRNNFFYITEKEKIPM